MLIRGQRLRLPPRTVEREHQLSDEALPQSVLANERLELPDQLSVLTERELRVDPLLERRQP